MTARNWKQFPPEYTKILTHFENNTGDLVFPMTGKEANHIRRDMYRFGAELGKASKDNPEARHLEMLHRRLVFSIYPGRAKGSEPAKLIIRHNDFLSQVEELLGSADEATEEFEHKQVKELPEAEQGTSEAPFDIDLARLEELVKEMESQDG